MSIRTVRRIPRDLPFVMRHSRTKFALLFVLAAAVVEIGLVIQTPPDERADMFGTVWVHALIGGIFVLCWVLAAVRGPTFALDAGGVWVALRGWPRALVLWVPWPHVARVVQSRYQWHSAVGVALRDPTLLHRDALRRNVDSLVEASRKHYGTDLSASLTLSDSSPGRVAHALERLAPSGVEWHLATGAAPRAGRAGRWIGRITVTVSWVVLFLFVLPLVTMTLLGAELDSIPGLLATFASVTIGTATLPKVLSVYEGVLARRR